MEKMRKSIASIPQQELEAIEPSSVDFKNLRLAFESYASERNFDLTRSTGHATYQDMATEIAYIGFKEVIRDHRKALVSLFSRQKVKPPFVVGRYVSDGTVQFANRPRRHTTIEKAKEQATHLSSTANNHTFGVFGELFRVGEVSTPPEKTWSGK